MPLYFAYGSNLSSTRLRERLGAVDIVGVALLPDYRHCFDKHGADGTAKGNVVAAVGARVLGVVYEVDLDQLSRLAVIEGGYRQMDVRVSVSDAAVVAVSFEALVRVHDLEPTADYLEHYRRGFVEHDFPEDYRRELLGIYSDHAR